MSPEGSVTRWIEELRAGDQDAAQALWERYFARLVRLAQRRLGGLRRAVADEEDVALSAFHSLCRALAENRYPQLHDRESLWRLLVVVAEHKSADLARAHSRARRGGGRIAGGTASLTALPTPEPSPEFAALVAEECERLLGLLNDDTLRRLVLLKLEGYTDQEVAEQLGCALRTVERKLRLVRQRWENEVPS